uniref:F-box domain-containing protein n=2 Tax=Rhodosorus marinus TaxID=101924 RepID=A0A7S3EMX0_9RHOD|mmetsp:Transcript_45023/g.174780  ORF Transcript_45023/g.174780 Transcript_45023/m.174780 type:complete len:227 (+) Transcript_45023:167-847(+)
MLLELPDETLFEVLMKLDGSSLCRVSVAHSRIGIMCRERIWPSKAAQLLGVKNVAGNPIKGWLRFYGNMAGPSGRDGGACNLYILHEVGDTDTIQGLSLRYEVDTDLICRYNALMSQHHLTHRSQVFIPVVHEEQRMWYKEKTGDIVYDPHVGREYVVVRKVATERVKRKEDRDLRRQRIRDLMVSLVARGLHVEEAEARFYLDDANMDVGLACRTLVEDRKWSSS